MVGQLLLHSYVSLQLGCCPRTCWLAIDFDVKEDLRSAMMQAQ